MQYYLKIQTHWRFAMHVHTHVRLYIGAVPYSAESVDR